MENRNRDRDSLEKKQRESNLPSTSSPGSQSNQGKGNMDRSTRGSDLESPVGSSQSGSDRSRSLDDESEIGSPGRDSDR